MASLLVVRSDDCLVALPCAGVGHAQRVAARRGDAGGLVLGVVGQGQPRAAAGEVAVGVVRVGRAPRGGQLVGGVVAVAGGGPVGGLAGAVAGPIPAGTMMSARGRPSPPWGGARAGSLAAVVLEELVSSHGPDGISY